MKSIFKVIIIVIMSIGTAADFDSGGKPKPQVKIVHVQQQQ